jgi:hypothetical protein
MQKKISIIYVVISLVFFLSCGSEKKELGLVKFDRGEMLLNYANNLIIPAYNNTLVNLNNLGATIQNFELNPTENNLLEVQLSLKKCMLSWQHANGFNFGPAGEQGIQKSLQEEIATFPVNTLLIGNYILANDTFFNNFSRDTRGFFAIEYLVFDSMSSSQIVDIFKTTPNRFKYLKACFNHLQKKVFTVSNGWNTYKETFISNNGTDIGSSTSYLYNEFLKSFESLKNYKFGIPLGLRPGQTVSLPKNVEAYYSGYSSELAKENWKSIADIWNGKGINGIDGIGFKEYLEKVEGGVNLIVLTQQQLINTEAAFLLLPNKKLSNAITEDFNIVNNVHTELQKTTRFYKSDLSSLIGIAVTYSSGDGD